MGNNAGINDFLDLGISPRRDVGQGPRGLLLDVGFFVAQQRHEHLQGFSVEDSLSLLVRPGHDVSDGTQRRSLGKRRGKAVSVNDDAVEQTTQSGHRHCDN